MALDVTTYGAALRKSVDSVLAGTTAWVIFGYEGKSFTLQVEAEGQNKNDMFDAFSPGAVMYGFAKVNKPNALPSDPPKFVFISWQGECSPEKYKIICAQHGDVVKRFCRTVHITVQARSDDDLDWKDILARLAGSAVSGNSVAQTDSKYVDEDVQPTPVGSVYRRINPAAEIPKSSNHRNFWRQQQSGPTPSAPPKAQKPVGWVKPVCTDVDTNESIRARSQALKEARQAEVASVIQSRLKSRATFEHTNGESSNSYKKIDPRADILLARQLSKASCKDTEEEKVGTNWKRLDAKAEIMAAGRAHIKGWQPDPTIKVGTNYERPDFQSEIRAARANRVDGVAESTTETPINQSHPPNTVNNPSNVSPCAPSQPYVPPLTRTIKAPSPPELPVVHPEPPGPISQGTILEETNHSPAPSASATDYPGPPRAAEPTWADSGPVAVCLYNYTAGDDDELSFAEGDRIFQVQQIDEGWWLGVNAEGQQGLFPANYVELMA